MIRAFAALAATLFLVPGALPAPAAARSAPGDDDESTYYRILRYTIPPGEVLEVGGIVELPGGNGTLAVSTRRGEIWIVENALDPDPKKAVFRKWASGLHEVLGLAFRDGWLYAQQRGEITRVKDSDGDGLADVFETFADGWGLTGDYHEYAFGSDFDAEGNLWLVLCLTGSYSSDAKFRGWCLRVTPEGKVVATASGIRSPGGIGMNVDGELFYCDNQGPWNGTSSLKHLVPGSFQGHPVGNKWYADAPEMGPRPQDPRDNSRFHLEAARIPEYVPPAVLLPHQKVGVSASGIAADRSKGKFGPFAGHLFVSDQGYSNLTRVVLERINGRYQGVAIPFRAGFGSGNVPTVQASDGSLIVGGTNRGWGSRGREPFALERVVWTGKVPFEVLDVKIRPDGFRVSFTEPVDPETAADPASYAIKAYTYIYRAEYGSPEVDETRPTIESATVAPDGKSVDLRVNGLQIGHVHEVELPGVRSAGGGAGGTPRKLLHPIFYYTLWNIPPADRP